MSIACNIHSVTYSANEFSKKTQKALASLQLEGIEPSPDLQADIRLYEAGQLPLDQLVQRGVARATR